MPLASRQASEQISRCGGRKCRWSAAADGFAGSLQGQHALDLGLLEDALAERVLERRLARWPAHVEEQVADAVSEAEQAFSANSFRRRLAGLAKSCVLIV